MDDNGDRKLLRAYAYSADGKVTGIKDYRNFQNGSTADYILRSYSYDSNDRVAKIATEPTGKIKINGAEVTAQ